MNKFKSISLLAGLSAVALVNSVSMFSGVARADLPGKHPYYLHALTDLRTARWMLEHRPGDAAISRQEDIAIQQIDASINEIKRASIDDGKNLHDHPAVDVPKEPVGRLHRAVALLNKAHQDVAHEEDDPTAQGLKRRSLRHIDVALKATRQGIYDAQHHK